METSNRLGLEKSPYLLQHKDNPVHWMPWGEEAFLRAAEEDKPVFLSIGYSTCYWCHVMDKDSFEQEDVAGILNEHFIPVKVDREERADVDKIYMDAVVSLSGRGGWPLTVFLTPDKNAFWGGTFFFKDQFKSILIQIHRAWELERERIVSSAITLREFLLEGREPEADTGEKAYYINRAFAELVKNFDGIYGGFRGAPKFPPSQQIAFLLRYSVANSGGDSEKAQNMAFQTLHSMANGGLYDHVGGGFHRYSVDEKWTVPHFEKMLYDNALLARVYAEAFQISGERKFSRVSQATLDYCLREMRSPEGAFYTAEDAGEVEREGGGYVWTLGELKDILSKQEFDVFSDNYDISEEGNFEANTCVLRRKREMISEEVEFILGACLLKLFESRDARVHPRKDDKVLVFCNALMISALCSGYQAFSKNHYLEAAKRSALFIKDHLWVEGALKRRYREGEVKYDAFLEDYAFFIDALISLYECDFNLEWLRFALRLQELQDCLFGDEKDGGYYFSCAKDIPFKKKDFVDGAIPSGNSMSFCNLLRLQSFFPDRDFGQKAQNVRLSLGRDFYRHPTAFSKILQGLQFELCGPKVYVLVGDPRDPEIFEMHKLLSSAFSPGRVLAFSSSEMPDEFIPITKKKYSINGLATLYICEGNVCGAPIVGLDNLRKLI
ncbi:MAG: thioredoxin domain-containing protein [SAR324 cluster bacterium]|uniref:Thioredoxin domain-containing protein n=1 Tax=SAR324 cluster bacterium TaxID=2024889 RepID=A0A7X9FRC5_9DELT|nr:thioredoxin domain-containing protein [SAR324 cluster bacterium]